MDGVVFEQMRQGFGVGKIVDCNDLDPLLFHCGAEYHPPDSAKTVDTQSDCHDFLLGILSRSNSPLQAKNNIQSAAASSIDFPEKINNPDCSWQAIVS